MFQKLSTHIYLGIQKFFEKQKGHHRYVLSNNYVQPTSKHQLMTMFEFTENDIKQIDKLPFKTANNCKFQWLQQRINHFRLTTNTILYKIKIKQDPLCSFCKKK